MKTGPCAAAAGRRVLVVEDEYFVAKELALDLEGAGVEVVGPAPSVAKALGLIGAGRLDGASLDVSLRGEPVYPVADALAEAGVPFVFVTGYDAEVIPDRFADSACLVKPVETATILQALFPLPKT